LIRAVLFDLDGTLYDRDDLVLQLARDQYREFRKQLGEVDEPEFVARLLELDAHGYGDRPRVYPTLAADFGLSDVAIQQMEARFWESYDRGGRPTDDTVEALTTLRDRGIKLGVVSNGRVHRQTAKLAALGIDRFFDVVLISDGEGVGKPDPRIFHRGVDRCGVVSSEAMYVGDNPQVDVAGARSAGLVPVWKRVPYWELSLQDVLVVDRLTEILPVCLPS